jgi:hypothetical protein
VHILFRIRIHNLKLGIRIWILILQKVSDPDPQNWYLLRQIDQVPVPDIKPFNSDENTNAPACKGRSTLRKIESQTNGSYKQKCRGIRFDQIRTFLARPGYFDSHFHRSFTKETFQITRKKILVYLYDFQFLKIAILI